MNAQTTSGAPFWSGTKRQPSPIAFDTSDAVHMDFIMAAAQLRAFNYGIEPKDDRAAAVAFLHTVKVTPFEPKQGVKIAKDDAELKAQMDLEDSVDEAGRCSGLRAAGISLRRGPLVQRTSWWASWTRPPRCCAWSHASLKKTTTPTTTWPLSAPRPTCARATTRSPRRICPSPSSLRARSFRPSPPPPPW
jgi:hypothetical protein